MSIKSRWMTDHFNELSNKFWNPFPEVSFAPFQLIHFDRQISVDDNVELWKGKYGQHRTLNKKADKCGHVTWEAVDKTRFIYALIWEYEIRRDKDDTELISHKRLKVLDALIPAGPYPGYSLF